MRADRGEALHLARATLPLAVATTMIVLYGGVMVILVSLLTSEYETGLYVTSARVMEVVIGLPSIVTGLALPILTVANLTDRERLRSALQQMIELGLLISTLVAALIALTAPSIIALIGGPKFADAAPILAVQGIAVIGVFLNQTLQFALVSIHQQRLLIITNSIALAALVIYGLAFVSAFDAIGGAYAVIAGEATLAVLLLLTVRLSAADIQPSLRFIWKIALCAAAAMAASLVTLPSHWLNGLIGATVFAVVAIIVRAIPPELIVALAAPVMHQDRTRALLRRYYGAA
jgi:O-antigen/teichoic acid export membrane protein